MLETASDRLSERGGPHFGSPDKVPAVRLATLEAAGRARVPFTTGILIGIGETRAERIEALLAIRDMHERHGHIQEIIVQNFRAKPGTRMAGAAEPSLDEQVWTIAVARLIFGPAMNIQAPPNLRPEGLAQLIKAGINDWGGVSPVTPDHVNPEAPWPHLADLERATERAGRTLVERLAIYPEFVSEPWPHAAPPPRGGRTERHGLSSTPAAVDPAADRRAKSDGVPGGGAWIDAALRTPLLRHLDAAGLAREDGWSPGGMEPLPKPHVARMQAKEADPSPAIARILDRVGAGKALGEADIVALFDARGADFAAVCRAADELRAAPRRRHRHLHRQPQHQLHQHLHLRLQVLRLLQGPPQPRPPRHALRPRPRGDRRPHDRGLGARRHRGVPAGRHQAQLHRQHLSRHRRGGEDRRRPTSTCTPSRRWRSAPAPRR